MSASVGEHRSESVVRVDPIKSTVKSAVRFETEGATDSTDSFQKAQGELGGLYYRSQATAMRSRVTNARHVDGMSGPNETSGDKALHCCV